MHAVRRGSGKPLLLVRGIGATWESWGPVLPALAALHWFDKCGHFPHWDQPAETVELIVTNTG